jgi:UDP-N-acetyl-D-glucosamine dehydrogenase
VISHELHVDLWDAIRCAGTKPFGFQAFRPSPGVGGHCIPIDPNYLSYKVKRLGYPFRFVELAQEINQRMPAYVAQRVQDLVNDAGKSVKGSTVLILGVTYKANVADQRESPARPVARRLRRMGANLAFHDPYVDHWLVDDTAVPRVESLDEGLRTADVSLLLQAHTAYDPTTLGAARLLFDTRGVSDGTAEVL